MGTEIRCVVFDIDDTLYLEQDYVRSGFLATDAWIRSTTGVTGFGDVAWALFERGIRGKIFDEALRELGLKEANDTVRSLVRVYRKHEPQISLLPDALECLLALKDGFHLSVITDGPIESQRNKARALKLQSWCGPVILTSELGSDKGKPHPAAFELIEAQTGCRGPQCIYVADNPAKDFKAPAALGWHTLRVRRKGGLHYDAAGGADIEETFADCGTIANRLISPVS